MLRHGSGKCPIMNLTVRLTLSFAILLITAHRLPAPISEAPETTPSPQPNREVIPRPKPKPKAIAKPRATPSRSFAGTWSGSTVNSSSDGEKANSNYYVIRISDDEKTVLINWSLSGETMSGSDLQASCIRVGGTLTWNLTQIGETPTWLCTDTLRMNANGTASFIRNGRWIAGDYQGITYNNTGTLSRQGVSSPPPVLQPTATVPATTPITTAASKSVGGLPTAKPVPNKPGFVYNPFDHNSRVLLDIRGKGSGTKVKDPFSGKLFIVP